MNRRAVAIPKADPPATLISFGVKIADEDIRVRSCYARQFTYGWLQFLQMP